jgi:hypothetical protein
LPKTKKRKKKPGLTTRAKASEKKGLELPFVAPATMTESLSTQGQLVNGTLGVNRTHLVLLLLQQRASTDFLLARSLC